MPSLCNILNELILQLNFNKSKDLNSLVDLLFLCDFLQALETLCRAYWYPLYAYLRGRGYDRHQAEDYTQGFFTSLLEKQGLRLVDSERGKFRSYLLGALKHFIADEFAHNHAQKRGGGQTMLSLDFENAENKYGTRCIEFNWKTIFSSI